MFPLGEEGGDKQRFVYGLPVPGPIPAQSLATPSRGTQGLELVHKAKAKLLPLKSTRIPSLSLALGNVTLSSDILSRASCILSKLCLWLAEKYQDGLGTSATAGCNREQAKPKFWATTFWRCVPLNDVSKTHTSLKRRVMVVKKGSWFLQPLPQIHPF